MFRRFRPGLLAGLSVCVMLLVSQTTALASGPTPYTTTTTTYSTQDGPCQTSSTTGYTMQGTTIIETCTYTRTTTTYTTTTLYTPVPQYTYEQTGTTTESVQECCHTVIGGYHQVITGYQTVITGYKTVSVTYYKTLYHWASVTTKTWVIPQEYCYLRSGSGSGYVCYWIPSWGKYHPAGEWVYSTSLEWVPYTVSWTVTSQEPVYGSVPVYTSEPWYKQAPYYVTVQVPVYGNVLTGYTWQTSSHTTSSTSSQTVTGTEYIGCNPPSCGYGYRNGVFVIPTPYSSSVY